MGQDVKPCQMFGSSALCHLPCVCDSIQVPVASSALQTGLKAELGVPSVSDSNYRIMVCGSLQ